MRVVSAPERVGEVGESDPILGEGGGHQAPDSTEENPQKHNHFMESECLKEKVARFE